MGLFNRQDPTSTSEDEELELPTREDFRQPLVGEEPPPRTGNTGYGIDDAITLLRELPDKDDETLIRIVCKTLESAQIRTRDILKDADQKEQRLERERNQVKQDIASLEKQLNAKRQSLAGLEGSLEELHRTRGRLQKAAGQRAEKAEAPKRPKPAPVSEKAEAEPAPEPKSDTESIEPVGEQAGPIGGRRQRGPQR